MDSSIAIPKFSAGTTVDIRRIRFDILDNPFESQHLSCRERVAGLLYVTLYPPFHKPGQLGIHLFSFECSGYLHPEDQRTFQSTLGMLYDKKVGWWLDNAHSNLQVLMKIPDFLEPYVGGRCHTEAYVFNKSYAMARFVKHAIQQTPQLVFTRSAHLSVEPIDISQSSSQSSQSIGVQTSPSRSSSPTVDEDQGPAYVPLNPHVPVADDLSSSADGPLDLTVRCTRRRSRSPTVERDIVFPHLKRSCGPVRQPGSSHCPGSRSPTVEREIPQLKRSRGPVRRLFHSPGSRSPTVGADIVFAHLKQEPEEVQQPGESSFNFGDFSFVVIKQEPAE